MHQTIPLMHLSLSQFTKKEESLHQSHSIDEASEMHSIKKEMEHEIKELISK